MGESKDYQESLEGGFRQYWKEGKQSGLFKETGLTIQSEKNTELRRMPSRPSSRERTRERSLAALLMTRKVLFGV